MNGEVFITGAHASAHSAEVLTAGVCTSVDGEEVLIAGAHTSPSADCGEMFIVGACTSTHLCIC